MPAPLTTSFNVGTELQSVIITTNTGVQIPIQQIGHLETFRYRQEVERRTIAPCIYQGRRMHRNIYHDYSGDLMFDRFNGDPMNLMHNILAQFQATGQETYVSILAAIYNSGLNTTDAYLFSNAILGPFDAGDLGGTAEIKQAIPFICQTLTIVNNPFNVLAAGPSIPLT